jgi:NTP pyrophosphatase (non-canonical NTP hydrolase)
MREPWSASVVNVIADVVVERDRQEAIGERKRAEGIPWRSCADPAMEGGDAARFLVLGEEVGEVARAVLEWGFTARALADPASTAYQVVETGDTDDAHLRDELIQVAAVAVAWVESIDARAKGGDR